MPVFQDKNKQGAQQDNKSPIDYESIVVPSLKNPTEVVYLDRVDKITKEPVIGVYDRVNNTIDTTKGIQDYKITKDLPHAITNITFPVFSPNRDPEKIEPTYKKIVVIDTTVEDIRIGAYASHYKMVETVIKHDNQFEVQGFDMGVPGNSQLVDYEKYLKILSHLDNRSSEEWGPIKVLNLSFVKQVSFDQLNSIVRSYGNMNPLQEITAENVSKHSDNIAYAVARASYANDPSAVDFKNLIKEVDTLNSLMEKGVAVVISAGNSGPGMIDIRSALLPDLIVVGGKIGNKIDPRSANNSTIDTWEDFSRTYTIKDLEVILEGTSFSAPLISREVADMQGYAVGRENPLTIPKINEILRDESKKKIR